MTDLPGIEISGVTKRFGATVAVDAVSLAIPDGSFFALLGPSGCGKTTLLRMIGGFETPDAGRIVIEGQDVTDLPPERRPTNMVFQSYAVFPHLTVAQNVAYGLRRLKLPEHEAKRRVGEALEMVKLDGLAGRMPDQLSGGQRQRVALARALILRPAVLLLDEPLSALDKKLRDEMQLELRALQRAVEITFVFVTHDQEEALSMADSAAVMFRGRIAQVAEPGELYENPATQEVAAFIGSMTFFPAVVRSVAGGTVQAEAEGLGVIETTMPAGGADWVVPGARVTAGIRPEKLDICDAATPRTFKARATVLASSYLGDRSHYLVRLAGRDAPITVTYPNTDRDPTPDYATGTDVIIGWNAGSFVLLRS